MCRSNIISANIISQVEQRKNNFTEKKFLIGLWYFLLVDYKGMKIPKVLLMVGIPGCEKVRYGMALPV
jgi:hypothetical protein